MKIHFVPCLILISLSIFLSSCDKTPKGDKATITDAQKAEVEEGQIYAIDTTDSYVKFTGNGVGKNHPGRFKLVSGEVGISGNKITGGKFVIDIKSMKLEQEGAMIHDKLRPHLLSGDFFDANKFGTATFEITKIEPYQPNGQDSSIVDGANFNVSGNLKIKDDTRNITFPTRVELGNNDLTARANFNIDRTQWKINYGSDKTLGDKFISQTVNIEVILWAEKK
jgi:polyisoprenoid-binding protein YceI